MTVIQGEVFTSYTTIIDTSTTSGISKYTCPFNTYFMDSRLQYIVPASELTALGFVGNDKITEIRFKITSAPTGDVPNFRLALKNTSLTNFTGKSNFEPYSSLTELVPPMTIVKTTLIAGNWYSLSFPNGFIWDGTNLIIDISKDSTTYTDKGSYYVRTATSNSSIGTYHDSTTPFPYETVSTKTTSSEVPQTYIVGETGGVITPTEQTGAASLVGNGQLTVLGSAATDGLVTMTGVGTLTANGVKIVNASADVIGSGILTASQMVIRNAEAILTGIGVLTASSDGVTIVTASASLTGEGKFSANGIKEVTVSASLIGTGLFSVITNDVTVITGEANLLGVGKIIAEGILIANASANLTGEGTLSTVGQREAQSGANLKGSGTLYVEGQKIVIVSADLIGNGKLQIIDGEPIIGSILLQGNRELYVYLIAHRKLNVQLQAKRDMFVNLKGGIKMTAENQNFTMIQGDTKYITFTVEESNIIADLTGSSVKWGIKKSKKMSEFVLLKEEGTDITIGGSKVEIKLKPSDTNTLTGTYHHEAQITDFNGNVSTVLTGYITVKDGLIN